MKLRTLSVVRAAAILLALVAFAFLAGCESGPKTPTGPRPPTSPAAVELYSKAPKQYELLGMVETTEHLRYGEDFSVDPVVDELKRKAASQGANGILLFDPETYPDMKLIGVGAFYQGQFYTFPFRSEAPRAAVVQAIYVLKR